MAMKQLAALAALAVLVVPAFSLAGPVVRAPAGAVEGVDEGDLAVFKGVPYAEPPVGGARWTPPRAKATWTGVRPATDFGPACIQPDPVGPNLYSGGPLPQSEDCLTLNIWTPKAATRAPVLVWIHGGALTTGSSREPAYDGAALARQGIVLVSINYRLGVLGYLAHPQLSAESPARISGNYGLLDQIEALRWIRSNIASFGGDPGNVTIAGESAGGLSVLYLMASPLARGLFHKAIAESSYMISTPMLRERAHGETPAERAGANLAASLGGASIGTLRAMDAKTLTMAAAAAHFAPFGNIDGVLLTEQLVDAFDKGHTARVPLMAGFNAGEIRSLRMLAPPAPRDPARYEAAIRERYKDLTPEFLKLYPASTPEESVIATARDALYGWTAQRAVDKQVASGMPGYLYLFDHGYAAADDRKLHAFHGSELPFVFGTADRLPPLWPRPSATGADRALSEAMIGYWSSFAKTGAPKATGEVDWPSHGSQRAYLLFAERPVAARDPLPGMYRLNEQVVCRRRAAGDQPWNWNVGLWSPPLPLAPGCAN